MIFTEEEEKFIVEDYAVNHLSIYDVCEKYHIGKIRLKEILSRYGIKTRHKGKQELNGPFVLDDFKIKKYKNRDGYHFIAVDRNSGFSTRDYMNKAGVLTTYIKDVYDVVVPTLHYRNVYYMRTGNYWWEQWFDIVEEKDSETKKCPYCDWETTDITNWSGAFEMHLLRVHGISKTDYLNEHPEDRGYFQHAKMNRDEFIRKAEEVHKGEGLDYSKVVYINNRTKVCIIDPEYGEYWQTPSNHLKGQRHPSRRADDISRSKRMSQGEYIMRAKEAHKGEDLDYSKVVYKGMHKPICIIDPVYGEYWQEAAAHLKGCGHKKRGIDKVSSLQRYSNDKFKELCHAVHPEYILDKVNYKSSKTKVCIICPKHGEFMAYPDALLQGKGCPRCGHHLSHGEDELYAYVCSLVGEDNVIKGDKSVLDGLEIDVLIPSLKIGFEFDGLRWHSEEFGKDRNYHLNKTRCALSKGIRLIHIFEDEWNKSGKIVKCKISRILGKFDGEKVDARKCHVTEISKTDARNFMEKNHIQGFAPSTTYVGCFHKDTLIGVMTFVKRGDEWELNRFATDNSMICRGVGGKLFSWFVKHYNPSMVKSFLDGRWCHSNEDNVYGKMGFELEKILKPDYQYTDYRERFHKFGFRKQILHKKHGFPMTMTESQMTEALGYVKIWDCGLYKYVWRNKK